MHANRSKIRYIALLRLSIHHLRGYRTQRQHPAHARDYLYLAWLISICSVLVPFLSDAASFDPGLPIIKLFDELGDAEEIVHLLESHTLVTYLLAFSDTLPSQAVSLTLVSGTRNQTNRNMDPQKQEKVMKAPYPPRPIVTSMFGTARAMTRLKSHWVAAARATLSARRRAVGISET